MNSLGRHSNARISLLAQSTLPALVLLFVSVSQGADFFVSSASEISTALGSAQAGDAIVMTNGEWVDQRIDFTGFGSQSNPITLRAETPGQVNLSGDSRLRISGDWLVVDGLNFEGGALTEGDHVVQFRGPMGEATNSRLTNSAIVDYNPASTSTRYFWVSMYGQNNRVDNNYFSGQNHSGVTVTVWRDSTAADHHRIDSNHFANRPEGSGNGFETIRIGTSDESLSDSFTTVENNLFEHVDGEIEIISNKSGANVYRYNTFRESSGTLTLRHGNSNRVEGNFFLGGGKDGSGGVRVIGEDHIIANNYFHDLDGRAGGAISISAGVDGGALNEYAQVRNAVIAHNTIVDVNEAAIVFDHGFGSSSRTLRAEDVTIANNLISSTQDALFDGVEGANWTWEGNMAHGASLGSAAGNVGITVVDPMLSMDSDGIFRLSDGSPAINAAAGDYSTIIYDDMDGQLRTGAFDVGADEFSLGAIVRKPLVAGDVGPDWDDTIVDPPGGGPGCGPNGCAIQAEDYTAILDPDGDGNRWVVVDVESALGGQVLKAPDGDRVELGSELHDTIATFELEFETAGVYTAYYRARGFSGSTDSIFTPDGFDLDPDNTESLSSNGQFEWEKDSRTFTITESDLGVPLEFRLGMRENDAEIDAFVLNLNGSLTDSQLDELFAVTSGDYNGDGMIDAADYTVWRNTLGQMGAGLVADGNGNGSVDADDYNIWRNAYSAGSAGSGGAAAVADFSATIPEPTACVLCGMFAANSFVGRRQYRTHSLHEV